MCIHGVSVSRVYPRWIHGFIRVYPGCIWERLDIGRQPSARDRSLVAEYTGYTLDTLDAPKIHLRYTPGYTLDTPHIHPRYTRIHLGQGANGVAKDHQPSAGFEVRS